jgi:hypothetical protein
MTHINATNITREINRGITLDLDQEPHSTPPL